MVGFVVGVIGKCSCEFADCSNCSICSRIAGFAISAKLIVSGIGFVGTKKESMVAKLVVLLVINGSDGGFVVGCVSRSSSGVLRAMVKCVDVGRED